jgi:SAM-dependent methyltransferase
MSVSPQARAAEHPALGRAYALATARVRPLTPLQRQVRDAILAADQPADYEPAPCLCGQEGGDIVLAQAERHGLPYRKVACPACGLLRADPRWTGERYGRFYEDEYRDLYNPIAVSKEQHARELSGSPWFRALADWVMQGYSRFGSGNPQPRVVEIGAGGGWNLGLLPERWQRVGYDVDREYLEIGERLFGCQMRYGFVADALADLPGADLVLLSHVVEHFSDPVAELAAVAEVIPAHGLLLIEVPGIFRIHRTNLDVMSYMQNAHTFTFCAATLRDVCRRAGLEVLQVDETVRAICRRVSASEPLPTPMRDAGLAGREVAYLRRCEAGYQMFHLARRVPGIGRYLAAAWRRLYFPLAGIAANSISGKI